MGYKKKELELSSGRNRKKTYCSCVHFIANSFIFNSTTVPVDNVQNFLTSSVFVNISWNFWRSSLDILGDVLVVGGEF